MAIGKHYRYMTEDSEEIIEMFIACFFNEQLHDLTWFEDVTGELFDTEAAALTGNSSEQAFTVRYRRGFMLIGIFCLAFFGFFMALPLLTGASSSDLVISLSVFGSLALLSAFIIWVTIRQRIIVRNDRLRIVPIFGITRDISIVDIDYVLDTNNGGVQGIKAFDHFGKKLFAVDRNFDRFDLLFDYLRHLLREDTIIVLKPPMSWSVVCAVVAVFFCVVGYFAFKDEGLESVLMIAAFPLATLLCMLYMQAQSTTLQFGVITARRPFRATITTQATDTRYGKAKRRSERPATTHRRFIILISNKVPRQFKTMFIHMYEKISQRIRFSAFPPDRHRKMPVAQSEIELNARRITMLITDIDLAALSVSMRPPPIQWNGITPNNTRRCTALVHKKATAAT